VQEGAQKCSQSVEDYASMLQWQLLLLLLLLLVLLLLLLLLVLLLLLLRLLLLVVLMIGEEPMIGTTSSVAPYADIAG
jgi:hypothetical protein